MTTIQNKLELLKTEIQTAVEEHNELAESKQNKFNQILELQGAIKALQSLNVDTDTDSEDS